MPCGRVQLPGEPRSIPPGVSFRVGLEPGGEFSQEQGEGVFRALEKQMIASAAESGPAVVATGGGAVIDPDNVRVMRASGQVIWLTASPETLDARVGRVGGRPLLAEGNAGERLGALLAERESAYGGAAHVEISTDGRDVADVVTEVLAQWHAFE